MTHVPVSLLRRFSWGPFWGLLVFAAALTWVSRLVFHAGLRRYESGNLIAPRL